MRWSGCTWRFSPILSILLDHDYLGESRDLHPGEIERGGPSPERRDARVRRLARCGGRIHEAGLEAVLTVVIIPME